MTTFPSSEWADAIWAALRDDEPFRRAAATWVTGPVLWTVRPSENSGLDDAVWLRFDIHEGDVREVSFSAEAAPPLTPTRIDGAYAAWKPVIAGSRSLYDGILAGGLGFTGDLPQVKLHEKMFRRMCEVAGAAGTAFPDETPAEAASANA